MLGKSNSVTCTSIRDWKTMKRCGTILTQLNGATVCVNCDRLPSLDPGWTHRPFDVQDLEKKP